MSSDFHLAMNLTTSYPDLPYRIVVIIFVPYFKITQYMLQYGKMELTRFIRKFLNKHLTYA